ncbi:MAG TPA: DMT family transporter, partial [Verrucomicrobiota bacterium]|nr:DMT family transporter [Verrucomicrobiota bacterium]
RILVWSCAACAPWLLGFALVSGETILPVTLRGWAVVLGLALTAHVLGQGLITYGFAHLPASFSSLTLLLQPVVAALAGWWLLAERLTAWQAAGGAVVLGGLWLARRGGGAAAERPGLQEPGPR